MTCKDVIAVLLDFLEASLTPEAVAEFERHLADCPPCQAYLNTYRRTSALTAEAARLPMPEELRRRLRELLTRELSSGPEHSQ